MVTVAIVVYARLLRPLGVRVSRLEVAKWSSWADRFLLPRGHVLRVEARRRRAGAAS